MRRTLAALLLVLGCGPSAPRATVAPATGVVRTGPLEDRFTLTGELAATKSDVLRVPRTPAYMISIKWIADDGATVKKGDRVVEFDTSGLAGSLVDRRLAVQRAQSDLISQTARNASAEMDKRLEVERKRVALEKARVEAAVPADLRTRREHQEKELEVVKAKDALAKAEEDLAAHRRAAGLDRRIAEIALARSTRELRDLEARLDELALRAPRDGLVQLSMNFRGEARKYQIGDTAYAGSDVATMPDLSLMHVRARLHDVDEGAVKVGMKADCVLDAHPGRVIGGVIESITPMARPEGRDAVRRVFDVVVTLAETDPEIMLPGMSVRVEVLRRRADKALLVPRHAVRSAGDKTTVRLRDGREVPVELEFCALQDCAIRRGPPEGTAVAAPADASGGGQPS